jgi:hypothetical protein
VTSSKYVDLYQEATKRQETAEKLKQDFYDKVCTFKPKLNPAPPEIAEKISQVDFISRGIQMMLKKEEFIKEQTKVVRRDPEIGIKSSKRPPNTDIYSHLYEDAKKHSEKLNELRSNQKKEMQEKQAQARSEKIDKLLWEGLDQKLTRLFHLFDVDGDA